MDARGAVVDEPVAVVHRRTVYAPALPVDRLFSLEFLSCLLVRYLPALPVVFHITILLCSVLLLVSSPVTDAEHQAKEYWNPIGLLLVGLALSSN